jgi:hypothetical protein
MFQLTAIRTVVRTFAEALYDLYLDAVVTDLSHDAVYCVSLVRCSVATEQQQWE